MNSMKHISADRIDLFEFHDAVFKLDRVDAQDIAVFAYGVNISKEAEQNPKGYDLEIKRAHITFYSIGDWSYNPGRTWIKDERGESVPVGPEIVYRGEKALSKITEALREGINVFNHSIIDGDHYLIEGTGIEPYCAIRFTVQEAVIDWTEYRGPAWYEAQKYSKRDLILKTTNGEIITEAQLWILYDQGELFRADDASEIDPKEVSVGIQYEGKTIWGRGRDCSGQDAFADLQRQLPDGVILKCCLSCRYGNQSPFSNEFDLIYCMKDVVVSEKADLCPYMTDATETSRRMRHYCDICEDWSEQSDETYVYSDFSHLRTEADVLKGLKLPEE